MGEALDELATHAAVAVPDEERAMGRRMRRGYAELVGAHGRASIRGFARAAETGRARPGGYCGMVNVVMV
jgi:hypothetical protein